MNSSRVSDTLERDLFAFEDETNPQSSRIQGIWPSTILDQVFDHLHPTKRNLREIIEDLRHEIITGGIGNIVFPVTSVNGQSAATGNSDIIVSASSIGLGRVDNTRDVDKPVSRFQEARMQELLRNFDFSDNVDFTAFYEHMMNKDNPHYVSWDQINTSDDITEFVNRLIGLHNISSDTNIHRDIRRIIAQLDNRVGNLSKHFGVVIGPIRDELNRHIEDPDAHTDLFMLKEDLLNKTPLFNRTQNNNDSLYPTTRAVVNFVEERVHEIIHEVFEDIPDDWIRGIKVVNFRTNLPEASENEFRMCYLIRHISNNLLSHGPYLGIAICRRHTSGGFFWDIETTGAITRLNPNHFTEFDFGWSLNPEAILDILINGQGGSIQTLWDTVFTREEADARFIRNVTILPGTMDGFIRYYINDDQTTMRREFQIPGLRNLAFKEWITEKEIRDHAIHERHIVSQAVSNRTIANLSVTATDLHPKIVCGFGRIIGNIVNQASDRAHEVSLVQLADYLRPLIGGWPDPGVPGGNPWVDWVREMILSPHLYEPGVEYDLRDRSFAMRFTGTISCLPNMNLDLIISDIIKLPSHLLLDAGGTWQISRNVHGGEWSILGGSNITGHTFGTVIMDHVALRFVSISTGDRFESPYDIWVRYIKVGDHDLIPGPAPGPIDPNDPPPNLILSTNVITFNDDQMTQVIDLSGNVGGPIMVQRINLPNEIESFVSGDRITFIANRPYIGSSAVNTSVMIIIHRGGIHRVVTANINLTPWNQPVLFHLVPNRVVVNDHQLVGTFLTAGISKEEISVDRTMVPAGIGIEIEVPTNDHIGDHQNHNGAVIVKATRPTASSPSIIGVFPLIITRQGMRRVVVIEANLTPLPYVTLLSQGVVSLSDTVLSTSVTVGGTTSGAITVDDLNALPDNITVSIDQITNIITITATRPTTSGSGTNSSYLLTVSRGGVVAHLTIETNLTPTHVTELSQSTVTLTDDSLSTQIVVTGTSVGTIVVEDVTFGGNPLPSNISVNINQTANVVTISATRPTTAINSTHNLGVSRGGAMAPLVVILNLTPIT